LIGLAYFIPTITLSDTYNFSYLPKLNATLNGLTFLSLVGALISIKNKKIILHRNFIFAALTLMRSSSFNGSNGKLFLRNSAKWQVTFKKIYATSLSERSKYQIIPSDFLVHIAHVHQI
jgi:hypothetical protein